MADPSPSGAIVGSWIIGGGGGVPFLSYDGREISANDHGSHDMNHNFNGLVRKVRVWTTWGDPGLRGIQVVFANGVEGKVQGSSDKDFHELTLAAGERITAYTLWGNGNGTWCGAIELETSMGQDFKFGKNIDPRQTAYNQGDVGSGLLMGIQGRSSDNVDQLGFIFHAIITKLTVDNLRFDTDIFNTSKGIESIALDKQIFQNSRHDQNQEFNTSIATGFSVTFSLELPEVGSIGASANWTETHSVETSNSTTDQITISWSESGTLLPRTAVLMTAYCSAGTLRGVPYTSTVTVNGPDYGYQFDEAGTYDTETYHSTGWMDAQDIPYDPSLGDNID